MSDGDLVPHPAKFTDAILEYIYSALDGPYLGSFKILDPFYGTGKLAKAFENDARFRVVGTELEHEWASQGKNAIQGDALQLPFADRTFDAVVTSPCYGNRMADSHNATDSSRRITYTHSLGHPLHSQSAGKMQWGKSYREFHEAAWGEVYRVLKPLGTFVLNVGDHIRNGERIHVSAWHKEAVEGLGFGWYHTEHVPTPKMGFGANGAARIPWEDVHLFYRLPNAGRVIRPGVSGPKGSS